MKPAVLQWAPTFEEAVAKAIELTVTYRVKFSHLENADPNHRYVVRKRRSTWPVDGRRRWNDGRHDTWLILTSPDIPDRDTSNPSRSRA